MREFTVSYDGSGVPKVTVDGVEQEGVVRAVVDGQMGQMPALHLTYSAGFTFQGTGDVVVTAEGPAARIAWLRGVDPARWEAAALAAEDRSDVPLSPGSAFKAALISLVLEASSGP